MHLDDLKDFDGYFQYFILIQFFVGFIITE